MNDAFESSIPEEYKDMAQLESLARTSAERFIERMDPHEAPDEQPLYDSELLRTQGTLHDMLEEPSCVELRHLACLARAMFHTFLEHAGLIKEITLKPEDCVTAGLGNHSSLGPPCFRLWVNDRGHENYPPDLDIPLTSREYATMPSTGRRPGELKAYPVIHPHQGFLCPLHRHLSERTYYKTTGVNVLHPETGGEVPFSTQLIHQIHELVDSVEGRVNKFKLEQPDAHWEFRYGCLDEKEPSFVLRKLMDESDKPCIRSTLYTELFVYGWRE